MNGGYLRCGKDERWNAKDLVKMGLDYDDLLSIGLGAWTNPPTHSC